MINLFQGNLVRLTAEDPSVLAEHFSRWSQDSEYMRLMDSNIARPMSRPQAEKIFKEMLEKENGKNIFFFIRTLDDNRLVGDIELGGISWTHGDAFVGIAIGERENWNKGYGTDAIQVMLRYAFMELNLRRISLNVFEYNPRAIHTYIKAGFREEGRLRQAILRNGKRWDMLFMGILREEWQSLAG